MDMALLKLAAGALVVVVLVVGCNRRDAGLREEGRQAQIQVENAQREKDRLENLKKEDDHRAAVATIDAKRVEEKQKYETDKADLECRIRAGDIQLHLARGVHKQTPVSPDAPAGRAEPEENPVVLPETAAAVLGVAGSAGQDVRDYNALLDAYHALERGCRGVDQGGASLLGDPAGDLDAATGAQ